MKNLFNIFLIVGSIFTASTSNAALTESDRAIVEKSREVLKNSGFENGKVGWTASGGTFTVDAASKDTGNSGASWDSNSASQTLKSDFADLSSANNNIGLKGENGVAYCRMKAVSSAGTHTAKIVDGNGSDLSVAITPALYTDRFQTIRIGNFIFPNTGNTTTDRVAVWFTSVAANEPGILIDNCTIKKADNIIDAPLITAWTSYTPTFTGLGTNTSIEYKYRRVGSNMEIVGKSTVGTTTATEARISLPTGFTSADTSTIATIRQMGVWVNGASSANHGGNILVEPSVTYVTMNSGSTFGSGTFNAMSKQAGNNLGLTDSSSQVSISVSLPIQGWSAGSAVAADQADFGWTSYTPAFVGLGTTSNLSIWYRRVEDSIEIKGIVTAGTTTATQARFPLPDGLTIASNVGTDEIAGIFVENGDASSQALIGTVIANAGNAYFTFGRIYTGVTEAFTSKNGNGLISSNSKIGFIGIKIPVTGWTSNQRAGTLIGNYSSNGTSAFRTESAYITNSGTPTDSTHTAAWINSLTDNGTGDTTVNIVTGTFSATPWCHCTAYGSDFSHCSLDSTTAASSSLVRVQTDSNGNTAADRDFIITCTGPR